MKILLVHNRYQIAGGECVVVDQEKRLLEMHGHDVAVLQVDNEEINSFPARCHAAFRTIYSYSSRRLVSNEISKFHPDIVHIHNFFPLLSPSVYHACREHNVSVVQTLHNYRLICPNALCFRDGHPCEDCVGKSLPWPGVYHACYRQSHLGTAPVAGMIAVHRFARTWNNDVHSYLALTNFARNLFIRGGLPPEKIVVKPNFVYPTPPVGQGNGEFALFVGRLSEEKGIRVLLAAWEKLQDSLPLRIVGDGPLTNEVSAASRRLKQVSFEGRLPREQVLRLMAEAKMLIFPSIWYETFGMTIIEAYAVGLPVIASNLGVMPSLVRHGHTGLLFAPGQADDLAAQVRYAKSHPKELAQMRLEARAEFLAKYSADRNYEMLMNIYQSAISDTGATASHSKSPECC
jgi:glycosyltransferase involved in cell wall biosynthesis